MLVRKENKVVKEEVNWDDSNSWADIREYTILVVINSVWYTFPQHIFAFV